jgi:hypothetical protein
MKHTTFFSLFQKSNNTMNNVRIFLHSGLGNQLFQWSFGHYLFQSGINVQFVRVEKIHEQNHANFRLENLISTCAHGQFVTISRFSISGLALTARERNFPISNTVLSDYSNQPNFVPSARRSRNLGVFGYFQTAEMIREVSKLINVELLNSLADKSPFTSQVFANEEYSVIHFRRGDLKSSTNREKIGLLDRSYYFRCLEKASGKLIVLTDDYADAEDFFVGDLTVDEILGPDDIDNVAGLYLMSFASKVFTANSTFSWWGAYLASIKKGEVFIPEPFFKGKEMPKTENYKFDGFQTLSATFEV